MKKSLILIVFTAIALLFLVLAFSAGQHIPYGKQLVYFDNIRNIASIIFGVTGAWLALIYPKALSSAENAKIAPAETRSSAIQNAKKDSEVLIGFIRTMIVSIMIIALTLLLPFIKEILAMYTWALDLKAYFRGSMYSLLAVLSAIQLSLLVMTLISTYKALEGLNKAKAEATTRSERDQNSGY